MMRITGLLFILVCITACEKKIPYDAHGTLIGVDNQTCACCGGIILKINNDTAEYRVDSLMFVSKQDLYSMQYPRRIHFFYGSQTTCGNIIHMTLDQYETEARMR